MPALKGDASTTPNQWDKISPWIPKIASHFYAMGVRFGSGEPLISEFLTTALEESLPKLSNLIQNSNIHTPGPGDSPIADVH